MGFGAATVWIGIGAAAVCGVSHTITDTLVKVALNRELPKLPIKTEKAQKMLMGSVRDTAWLQEAAERLCRRRNGIGPEDCTTTDALQKNKIPVLFIHGEADGFVPVEMTHENHAGCSANKMLLIVPGADHGLSYLADKEGYEKITKEFWHQHDGSAGN